MTPDLKSIPGVFHIQKNETKYIIEVEKIIDSLPELLKRTNDQNIKIKNLECRKVTLDDLFISMTGRHLTD
jgi:ABC-2 type transport system ATP-binding protein